MTVLEVDHGKFHYVHTNFKCVLPECYASNVSEKICSVALFFDWNVQLVHVQHSPLSHGFELNFCWMLCLYLFLSLVLKVLHHGQEMVH